MDAPTTNSQPSQTPADGPGADNRLAGQVGRLQGRSLPSFGQVGDTAFKLLCQAAAVVVILLAVFLLAVLLWKSWLAIQTIGASFLTTTTWDPEPTHRVFGALAFVYGTVMTSALAMLLAVPLGIGTAAYLSEIATGWVRRAGSFLVEMLAAVPSVVYGFWGLFVVVPALQQAVIALGGPNMGGTGILAASLVLAIMIVPYVAAVSFDVFQAVPRSQREAAYALGASRWQTIWSVVIPYARPGIVGGCFIALGRALGETMAVTMLIGKRPDIVWSVFAKGNSIASVIACEFTEATYDLYLSALVELGLVLLLVSMIVNSLARLLIWRVSRPGKGISFFAGRFGIMRKGVARSPAGAREAVGEVVDAFDPSLQAFLPSPSRKAARVDRLMTGVLAVCLALTIGPLFLILGHLLYQGFGSLNWEFFVNKPAPVGEAGGGMANALYGSLLLVGLATLFAVPIGLLAAIYLSEYRSDCLAPAVRFIGELLGGVPSIVIGLFVYALVVKPMGHFSGWAGGVALGIMMVPIVMRASEEALKLVPRSLREASHALGAHHYQTVWRVIVPAALPAIITAVFLAIARVAGETAPLILTASGNQFWPRSPNDPTPSLPYFIYNYAVSPYEDWHRQAWAAALVLLVVVMLLNFGVRFLTGKRVVQASRAD